MQRPRAPRLPAPEGARRGRRLVGSAAASSDARGTRARTVTRDDPARKGLRRRSHQRDRPHPRLFDAGQFDLVVFEEWCLRTPRNTSESRFRPESRATFVQGYAGIPGLVAEQMRPPSATAQSDPAPQSHTTASPGRSASPSTRTTGRHRHRLVGHLVRPPGTESTSRVILDEELPTGAHTIAIPDEVPAQASFATVSIGPLVHAFIVGPMPSRTTMARLPSLQAHSRRPAEQRLQGGAHPIDRRRDACVVS